MKLIDIVIDIMYNNVQQNVYISFILKFDTCLKNIGNLKKQGK